MLHPVVPVFLYLFGAGTGLRCRFKNTIYEIKNRQEWDDTFSVNNAEIDDQHRGLIEIINELHDTLMKEESEGTFTGKINALESMNDYARYQGKWCSKGHFNFNIVIPVHRIGKVISLVLVSGSYPSSY